MKNLIGAAAPTNRVVGSFKVLMLTVLVAIGFTSCKDQSKSEVSPETELIAKTNLLDAQSNFDIGGNGGQERRGFDIGGIGGNQAPPRRICEVYSTGEIGGGKNSTGGLEKPSDTGGRGRKGTSTGGDYNVSDIGGRSTTGEFSISDIGGEIGGRGTGTGTGEIGGLGAPRPFSEIGGRQTSGTGNYVSNDIGGGKGTSTDTGNFSESQYDHLKIYWNEFD